MGNSLRFQGKKDIIRTVLILGITTCALAGLTFLSIWIGKITNPSSVSGPENISAAATTEASDALKTINGTILYGSQVVELMQRYKTKQAPAINFLVDDRHHIITDKIYNKTQNQIDTALHINPQDKYMAEVSYNSQDAITQVKFIKQPQ